MRTKTLFSSASIVLAFAVAGCSAAPSPASDDRAEVGSTSEALGRCGLPPKAPPCNTLRCTADGWDFVPVAAGATCRAPSGAGTCNASGSCIVTPPKHGTVYPAYYVLTLLYNAPGAMSEVDYGAQSTVGSEVDTQNLFKGGEQVQAGVQIAGNGTQIQYGFADGSVDGKSWEISKTQASTISLTSQADALSHMTDTFFLWTNAELDLTQVGTGPIQTTLTSRGGAAPIIVPVTVAELKNPSLLPAWKQSYLTALKPADYASILGLDPLIPTSVITAYGQPQPDPARFNKITSLQLDGPDHVGDPIPGFGIAVTNESTTGSLNGYNSSTTVTATFMAGFNLFDVLTVGAQYSETFEWDYQKTTQSKLGTSQTATVMLKTGTVGYHDVVDVYYDTLFNSFAFAHAPLRLGVASGSLVGTALSARGVPLGNRPVTVTFADGQKRTVVTNAQGVYRVFGAPVGEAKVYTGRESARVVVTEGRETPVSLRFAE